MADIAPPPQGHYVPAKRHGDLIYVSGMTPRQDGTLLYTGQVRHDTPLDTYRPAAELATGNALKAAKALLADGEIVQSVLSLTVYVNAPPGFTAHSKIADFSSALIAQNFAGDLPSRAAIGASSLPGDALLEVSLVVAVAQS